MYPTEAVGTGRSTTSRDSAQPSGSLSDHRNRIRILVEIAAQNASSISLIELLDLLPPGVFLSADHLRSYISADEHLSRRLSAVGTEVTLRGQESLAAERSVQRDLARDRLASAEGFLGGLAHLCPWIEVAGVSGSTAYSGAKPTDDIDFFLVTRRRRLWITLFVALALGRIARSGPEERSVYCFNRLMELPSCERTFREKRDPLFAREALSVRVLHGHTLYAELLRSAPWMSDHFPRLYASRMAAFDDPESAQTTSEQPAGDILNAAMFLILAPYLVLVGLVRNRRLRREGRDKECFRVVVKPDFCATESVLFDELRDEYRKVFA